MNVPREVLTSILEENGSITPELVVAEAEDELSPLHSYFTWDDNEAARRYRLVEAGRLIRRVKVTIIPHEDEGPVQVRAFLSTNTSDSDDVDEKGRYISLEMMANDPEMSARVLEQMRKDWLRFRRKYQNHLAALRSVVDEDLSDVG